jgi:hypothetical protein
MERKKFLSRIGVIMQNVILLVMGMFVPTLGYSQSCDICEKVLVQDYISVAYDESTALHYLNTIDASTYSKEETKSALSAAFPIDGVPVGGDVSWNDFSEYRSRLFSQQKFDYSKAQSFQYVKNAFSQNTLSAFSQCMQACGSKEGVFVYMQSVDDNLVSIAIDYKNEGSRDRIMIANVAAENLKFVNKSDSIALSSYALSSGTHKEIKFKRLKQHEFAYVQLGVKRNQVERNYTITVTPKPIIKKYKRVRLQHSDKGENHKFSGVNIIEGACIGDPETPTGQIMPGHVGFRFGPWANTPCGKSGDGWHYFTNGTCGTAAYGILPKGLQWIEVWVEDR